MKEFKLNENDKSKAPFAVPEDYFDKLNEEILSKTVNAVPEKQGKQLWLSPIKIAVAATISLLAVVSVYYSNQQEIIQTPDELLAEVSSDDILYYLAESDITEDDIINELNLENLEFVDDSPLDDLDLEDLDLDEFIYDLDLSENI